MLELWITGLKSARELGQTVCAVLNLCPSATEVNFCGQKILMNRKTVRVLNWEQAFGVPLYFK